MAKGEIVAKYPAVAVGFNIAPAEGEKAPKVEVEMRGLENEEGKTFFLYLSLKEGQAQEISVKTLRNLGWKCNDITKLEGLGDTKVTIVEKREEYKGKMRAHYDVWPASRPTLRDDEAQGFAAQFKALAAAFQPIARDENNAAPTTIPEPRATNGAKGGVAASSETGAAPSDLYA